MMAKNNWYMLTFNIYMIKSVSNPFFLLMILHPFQGFQCYLHALLVILFVVKPLDRSKHLVFT